MDKYVTYVRKWRNLWSHSCKFFGVYQFASNCQNVVRDFEWKSYGNMKKNLLLLAFSYRMPLVRSTKTIFWIFYNVIFTAACQVKPCTVRQYHFSRERDSMENYALCGYSFKNLTVSSHKHCFEHCVWECRCISFNYLITATKDNCQLNEENRYLSPRALKRRHGHSYHEIGIDYNVKVRDTEVWF